MNSLIAIIWHKPDVKQQKNKLNKHCSATYQTDEGVLGSFQYSSEQHLKSCF